MSLPATPCYQVVTGKHYHPNPNYVIGQALVYPSSPAFTAVTTHSHHSPIFTISPLPGVTPLPGSFAVVNLQNAYNTCSPPSPAVSALVLTTPYINPLVAVDSGLCHGKVNFDVSKVQIDVRVSKFCGNSAFITDEQKDSLVVEGALHGHFRIEFDHPGLTGSMGFRRALTVGDLLLGLHKYFHERIGQTEKYHLEKDMDLWKVASDTQVKRCQDMYDPRLEWDLGMKRVDVLGKKSKLRGVYLDPSAFGDHLTLRVVFGK